MFIKYFGSVSCGLKNIRAKMQPLIWHSSPYIHGMFLFFTFQLKNAYAIAKLQKTGYWKQKFYKEMVELYSEVWIIVILFPLPCYVVCVEVYLRWQMLSSRVQFSLFEEDYLIVPNIIERASLHVTCIY